MPPRISVVTINRNMAAGLAITMESVLAQSCPDIEYIIIDGNSSDGSLGVIQRHVGRIAHWVSERDRNLYDAMNKGVGVATGEWVIFMNSGDIFADADVVRDVFAANRDDADLVYGHAVWHHPRHGIDTMRTGEDPASLPLRMNCSHQALFARRALLLRHPFADGLLVADYEFLLWAWLSHARFKMMDRVIVRASAGGVSDRQRLRSILQRMGVVRRAGLMRPGLAVRYCLILLFEPLTGLIKSWMPVGLARVILRARRGH